MINNISILFLNATSTLSHLELQHRIQIAWHAFHKHRRWLLNRNIQIQLRLRLFSSAVTPSALFTTSVLSLTRAQLNRLGFVQRKMLRYIVRWVRINGEDWEIAMHRMLHISHSDTVNWVEMDSRWHPPDVADVVLQQQPKRSVGRPRARWDDAITSFAITASTIRCTGLSRSTTTRARICCSWVTRF